MVSDVLGRRVALDAQLTCSGMRTDHLWRGDAPTELLRARFEEPADLVTLTIGANDLIPMWFRYVGAVSVIRPFRPVLPAALTRSIRERFVPESRRTLMAQRGIEQRLHHILEWIADRSPSARIVTTSYYLRDVADVTRSGFSRPLHEAIFAATGRCAAASMVDLTAMFAPPRSDRGLISRLDGLHPTSAGQHRIARAVAHEAVRLVPAPSVSGHVGRDRSTPRADRGG